MADYLKLAREARKQGPDRPTSGEPQSKYEFNEFNPAEPVATAPVAQPSRPRITVPPEKLAEFQSAIDEFTQAGFRITGIRDGSEDARGIPEAQWPKQQLRKLCAEIRQFRPVLPGTQRRPRGESALSRPHGDNKYYEWNYVPERLMESTWTQMSELARNGEYDFVVIAWPEARVLYDSTCDGPFRISEEEPQS